MTERIYVSSICVYQLSNITLITNRTNPNTNRFNDDVYSARFLVYLITIGGLDTFVNHLNIVLKAGIDADRSHLHKYHVQLDNFAEDLLFCGGHIPRARLVSWDYGSAYLDWRVSVIGLACQRDWVGVSV